MLMNFNIIRHGQRFFFVTLVTAGRQAILSQRVGDKIAALLPAGERIINAFGRAHAQNPAVTISNRIIMPDHIHFLMRVNYDIAPQFDLGDWLIRFKFATGGDSIWDRKFYFQLSFDRVQLAAIRRYIKMNPARAHWKETHSDFFLRHGPFRHAVLPAGRSWYAIGNLTILASPFLTGARLTMGKTAAEHSENVAELVEKAQAGAVLVSGFISAGERALLGRLREVPGARFVRMVPYGLEARYDPSVEDSRALAEGRELILSGFAPGVAAGKVTRANCLEMNDLIKAMCEGAERGDFVRC